MKNIKSIIMTAALLVAVSVSAAKADDYSTARPRLFLSQEGVERIKESAGTIPAFDASVAEVKAKADAAIVSEIVLPQPEGGGGSHSHEQHKQNYYNMYNCGIMYQLTGDAKYAEYIKAMLYEYAAIYEDLPAHPSRPNGSSRLFHQPLNEYVWLVHTASAYDCIYNYLSQEDRDELEKHLFYPMAELFVDGTPSNESTFNRMHNHGTWAVASVGLIGYVMGDSNLVDKALYGTDKKGNGTGFVSQLGSLFSPDGYYTEGAYYQRYAIWPFILFAQAIDRNQPEIDIFNCNDGVLKKAARTLVDLSYNGFLFMMNDAVEKTLDAQEIVTAIGVSYLLNPEDKELLSIAEAQNQFIVSDAGLATAQAIQAGEAEPFKFKSRMLSDGAKGDEGGTAIIRANEEDLALTLVFKAASHGGSHGHFDKFAFTIHDNGAEIMPDYGASRFLNIVTKHGGGYTPQTLSYARQTISHNTVAVDEKSHFEGDRPTAESSAPRINYYGFEGTGDKAGIQIASSDIEGIYEGVNMRRTMAVIETGAEPLVVDIFRVESEDEHTYDLPFFYRGHLTYSNFEIERNKTLDALGEGHGYQHLWVDGQGALTAEQGDLATFTWVLGTRFYSVNTIADQNTEYLQVMAGANDPFHNLRNERAVIVRKEGASKSFISTIEPHGDYDLVMEVTAGYESNVAGLETLLDNSDYTIVKVTMVSGTEYTLCVQNAGSEAEQDALNVVKADNGQEYSWTGDYALFTK